MEIFPSSLTLPGGSEQSHFALVSVPHEPGIVNVLGKVWSCSIVQLYLWVGESILEALVMLLLLLLLLLLFSGYEATVFGVHYECYKKVQDDPVIRVVPKLPLVKIKSVLVTTSEEEEEGGGEGGKKECGVRRRSQSDAVTDAKKKKISQVGLNKFELLDGER